jgi:type VI secretion system protein ImpJ
MTSENKVVWTEGLFLRQEHFQQADRYHEDHARALSAYLRPFPWGLAELGINRDLLKIGKFSLTECRGILQDGTPFAIPDGAHLPTPLDLPSDARDVRIFLSLPINQPDTPEIDHAAGPGNGGASRYLAHMIRRRDTTAYGTGASGTAANGQQAELLVGRLQFRYAVGHEPPPGTVSIGVARVVEVRPNRTVILDEEYIPPCMLCGASPALMKYLDDILGILRQRGDELARQASGRGTSTSEIASFLMLQAINRFEPEFSHFRQIMSVHPERFFTTALALAGEFATFSDARRPRNLPEYRHEDLRYSFSSLMGLIRGSDQPVPTAIPLELVERGYGIRVAPMPDLGLVQQASFVLAVGADMPEEDLRQSLPRLSKIGPYESIHRLVNNQIPGIGLRALPVPPSGIPYHRGKTYFELEPRSAFWKEVTTSGLALHLAGNFPQIDMDLWAIRRPG